MLTHESIISHFEDILSETMLLLLLKRASHLLLLTLILTKAVSLTIIFYTPNVSYFIQLNKVNASNNHFYWNHNNIDSLKMRH